MTQLLIALALLATIAAPSRTAPDITLRTADGGTVRLTDYKGRVVVVDFWASWCAPCKTAFPALDTLFREYHARGVEVLAVNLDERRRDADAFLAKLPHTMPVLFDPKGTSAEAFAVQGMPSSFVIDASGVIRFTHIGYSGDVGTSYRREIEQLLSEEKRP
jgi:peroxiredoxin